MTHQKLTALTGSGVSIWLDDLSRERLNTGNLADLIRDWNVTGVTTNPTIFANALSKGEAYDEQVRELAARGADVDATVREITTTDVRTAADVFRDVHSATNGVDGRVSIEVDPRLAHDTERTVAEAKDLWKTVDRPNLMVKIPATVAGLPAITKVLAEGINVNVTLIFSIERYQAVMDAFIEGIEQAKANGHDISQIHSVASFFVSRVDTEIDKRLDKLGTEDAKALRGQAAIANARLAYQAYLDAFGTDRWKALAGAGAHAQRPLWASTGVKDPSYPDTQYVDELVAPNVVNTMPEKTLQAVADHGKIDGDKVTGRAEEAQEVFDALSDLGIDLDDVFKVLEDEGVDKFEKSWTELLETVSGQLSKAKG
ncbi:transaldolase [Kibdelosporangium persicum]|uniref:Transaldolase n=1 Tax=Kibdelosporangium persicum TaxID=2698649 RepID=A0ABX2EZT2_9PSEU|nr:transaldolase [Kibdelosporangium persicum]NRN64261.1 Transaldolase [Kibdelosporangium persicum]